MAGDRLEFRPATIDDVDQVVALVESAYRGEEARQGWTTEADLIDGQRTDRQAVLDALGRPDIVILIGLRDGQIVACAQLTRRGPAVEFGMFAVRPQAQGAGLGAAVLSEAEALVRRRWPGLGMEMLVIRQRHELIEWYGRRGYEATGEYRPFPYGNARYGLPLRDDLEFVVLAKLLD